MAESLYQRLGGETGLSAIVTDTLENHLNNPVVAPRFRGADMKKLHKLAVEFFGMGSGGPQKYTGRDMKETHKGMNVSEQEFLAVVDDIMAALDKNNITPETKTEVLGILYSLKSEIIRG
jgi:hemoglobin